MDNSAHNYAVTNAYKTCGENGVLNGRNECVPRIRNNTPGAPVDLHGLFGFNQALPNSTVQQSSLTPETP